MYIEQLHYFLEIASYKSINLTGKKLHISQQTLSASLKKLELALGVPLFERNHHGIFLTKEGEDFLPIAQNILAQLQQFKNTHSPPTQALAGVLKIHTNPAVAFTILSWIISPFNKIYPQIALHIVETSVSQICQSLDAGQLTSTEDHVGLIALAANSTIDGFTACQYDFMPIASGKFVACVSENSPLTTYKKISIHTLLKYPFITSATDQDNGENPLLKLLSQYVDKPNFSIVTKDFSLYLQAIIDGVGVSLISNFSFKCLRTEDIPKGLAIIPLKENLCFTVGYLQRKDCQNSPLTKTLIDFIQTSIASQQT